MRTDQAVALRKMVGETVERIPSGSVQQYVPQRAIAITSGKGGVGKSNISLNLSLALTRLKKQICLFDADLGLANVDVLLGVHPQYNIQHVLSGEKTISEIMLEVSGGLKVISGGSGIDKLANLDLITQELLLRSFHRLDQDFDILLIDTGAGISRQVTNFVLAANEVIVILTPEPTSLTDAYAMIKFITIRSAMTKIQILVNMAKNEEEGMEIFSKIEMIVRRFLGKEISYLGSLLMDNELKQAVRHQIPVIQVAPRSLFAAGINQVAKKICGMIVSPPQASYFSRLFGFCKKS